MAMANRCRIEAVQQRTSLEVQISQRIGPKVHSKLICKEKYFHVMKVEKLLYWAKKKIVGIDQKINKEN